MAIGTPILGTSDQRSASSTTSTPGYPVGIAAGDIMLLWGFSGNSNNSTFTTPASFTQVMQAGSNASTQVPNFYLAWAVATGSESGTLTCTHGNVPTTMAIMSVSGVDNTTPIDIAAALLDSTTASTTFTFPSQTVATSGAMAVYGVSGNSTTITATPATGFTEAFDRVTASTRSHEVAWKAGFSAGASGSISAAPGWSGSSKPLGVLIFLRPDGATNVNADVAIPLTDTVTSTAQVGVATGATVPLTDTVTSAAQVGVVAGAAIALTATIAASLVVGTSSGASVNETTSITSAAQVGVSSGATVPLTATISSALSVGGSAVSIASTVPLTDTVASTAVVGVSSGAALSETATVTSAAQVGKQTGASLSESVAVTSTAQVGKAAGASIAPVFAVTANGVVGVQPGASVGVTFAVASTISVSGALGPPELVKAQVILRSVDADVVARTVRARPATRAVDATEIARTVRAQPITRTVEEST